GQIDARAQEKPQHPLAMTLEQRHHQRVLAREILVQRPDAHARDLGDAVGARPIEPLLDENASRGLEDGLDRGLRSALSGALAREKLHAAAHAGCSWNAS